MDIHEILKKDLPGIQKNVLLKHHTTFNIGGPAEHFLATHKKEEITRAIKIAKKLKLPIFLFGGGSNVLVSDKGVKGLVVKIQSDDDIILSKDKIIAHAGIQMSTLVASSIEHSLQGLEWAGGLPGTFGGAIRGNAGAFGGEIKDAIFSVEALDNNFKLRKLNNKQCQFSYRSSIFKKKRWLVLSATVKLKKGDKQALRDIANSRIAYRKEKHPLEHPNAGSVFKNVAVKSIAKKHQIAFKDKIKNDPFPIVPAAWFIIGAGLAGKKIGKAQISKKHSNYIINLGDAKAKDILRLIETVRAKVKKVYGVSLEMEVQVVE